MHNFFVEECCTCVLQNAFQVFLILLFEFVHSCHVFGEPDLDQSRLDFAKKMGADAVIKVTSRDPKDTAAQVEEALGQKSDVTIECSGAPPSIRTAIYVSISCILVFTYKHAL